MTGSEWHAALKEAVSHWYKSRDTGSLTIKVTLADGEWFYLAAVHPGPGNDFVTLSPFPEQPVLENMIDGAEGWKMTPRAVVVSPSFITKLELLYHSPTPEQAFGFGEPGAQGE